MKKISALILAVILIASLVSCTNNEENPIESEFEATEEGTTLNGKTLMEVYNAAIPVVEAMTSFELEITEIEDITYNGMNMSNTKRESTYKTDGSSANYKTSAGEIWYSDGSLYTSNSISKEKNEITEKEFYDSMGYSASGIMLKLEEHHFFGLKFIPDGANYYIDFSIIPDDYKKITGVEVYDVVKYRATFDANGNLVSTTRSTAYTTRGDITVDTSITQKIVKSKDVTITLPTDVSEYKIPITEDKIDKTKIESLDNVVLSANDGKTVTDYVKIDVAEYGSIIIKLYPEVAPRTVENFKSLVSKSFYDGTVFHRVIKDFVVQGGAPKSDYKDEIHTIPGEFSYNGFTNNLTHTVGVVAMARTADNNDSASTQFYIVQGKDQPGLDYNYATFGYVVYGMDVVDAIAGVETDDADKPKTEVTITSAKFVEVK